MKKSLLLTLLAVLTTALPALAYDFQTDGIYYNILSDKTCAVTYKDSNHDSYSGDIIIPSSVTYSGKTFSVTSIGGFAFENCTSLTSIEIPNSVTSIGQYAFRGCSSLTSVEIPNSVTSIGGGAFSNCTSLTSVVIGNSVTSIGKSAFYNCSSLTSFTGKFASEDNRCLIVDGVLEAFAPAGLTTYSIPNSVTSIGEEAFWDCTSLTSVEIPNSVTSIGIGEFSGCTNLASFTGKFASDDHRCLIVDGALNSFAPAGLTTYSIPNSVTSIGQFAFWNCSSLTSVKIPNSVTSIGGSAFENCINLTQITSLAVTPPTIYSYTFYDVPKTEALLKVPEESVEAYKSAEYWSDFSNIVPLSGGEGGEDPEIKQCALPTITLADGKLIATSDTEGSTCHISITSDDFKELDTNAPVELTGTYNISAYAHADGYTDSETALATLVWIAPDEIADDILCMEAKKPVIIRSHNNTLIISGTAPGEQIHLYTPASLQLASVTADSDQTVIPCSVPKGDIVIVKYGNRSIKITI